MKVKIDLPALSDNTFELNDRVWLVTSLIEKSKNLPVFDLPLAHIDVAVKLWDINTVYNFAYHMKKCNEADLSYPVIMDATGFIMDGWHRVAKALVLGLESIKCVRFEDTPPCDYRKDEHK
jgi:hypothetical protein